VVVVNRDIKEGSLRQKVWKIIFEAETPRGKAFDVALLVLIALSVLVVMLESVKSIDDVWHNQLYALEWVFTVIFTIEYIVRLWVVRRPVAYAKSFFGVVDLLSCLPMWISLFSPVSQSLLIIRVLRMLRIFRVLKMVRHVQGSQILVRALYASRAKITVFFFAVVTFTVIVGSVMYLIEGGDHGFTSIPQSIYWAIVTISTLGYGDLVPVTALGKFVTAVCVLAGYAIIAVPTGIISSALSRNSGSSDTDACPSCGAHGHLDDARYCRKCGGKL